MRVRHRTAPLLAEIALAGSSEAGRSAGDPGCFGRQSALQAILASALAIKVSDWPERCDARCQGHNGDRADLRPARPALGSS